MSGNLSFIRFIGNAMEVVACDKQTDSDSVRPFMPIPSTKIIYVNAVYALRVHTMCPFIRKEIHFINHMILSALQVRALVL